MGVPNGKTLSVLARNKIEKSCERSSPFVEVQRFRTQVVTCPRPNFAKFAERPISDDRDGSRFITMRLVEFGAVS